VFIRLSNPVRFQRLASAKGGHRRFPTVQQLVAVEWLAVEWLKAVDLGSKAKQFGIGQAVGHIAAGEAQNPLLVVKADHERVRRQKTDRGRNS
jgi:hypothetical protein